MRPLKTFHRCYNFFITVMLWIHFLFGYLVLFALLALPLLIIEGRSRAMLQRLNHIHLRGFFILTRLLIPRTQYIIPQNVRRIRSAIVVCNHLSYLDPILLVSLFPRQITIVKKTFFKVPIFGWFLKRTGYLPSTSDAMTGKTMIDHLESIKQHLAEGGVLFVFSEGTRSRDGKLKPFNKGVFSIARYCKAPVKLVLIKNTHILFPPGYFSFNTRAFNTIRLELIGTIKGFDQGVPLSASAAAQMARKCFEKKLFPSG